MFVRLQKLKAITWPVCGKTKQSLVDAPSARNVAILNAHPDIARHAAPAETLLARKQQKEVIALTKYKHWLQNNCRGLWTRFKDSCAQNVNSSLVRVWIHWVTGVGKRCPEKLKRDCPRTLEKNTFAELVKHWMQLRQVSDLRNDEWTMGDCAGQITLGNAYVTLLLAFMIATV